MYVVFKNMLMIITLINESGYDWIRLDVPPHYKTPSKIILGASK